MCECPQKMLGPHHLVSILVVLLAAAFVYISGQYVDPILDEDQLELDKFSYKKPQRDWCIYCANPFLLIVDGICGINID